MTNLQARSRTNTALWPGVDFSKECLVRAWVTGSRWEDPLLMPYPSTFDVRQDQFPNLFNGNEIHSSTNEVEELQTARSYNVVKAACAFYLQQCRVFHVAERLCVAGDRRCGVALWHYDTCHGFSLRWIQLSLTMMFLAVAIWLWMPGPWQQRLTGPGTQSFLPRRFCFNICPQNECSGEDAMCHCFRLQTTMTNLQARCSFIVAGRWFHQNALQCCEGYRRLLFAAMPGLSCCWKTLRCWRSKVWAAEHWGWFQQGMLG